MMRPVVVHNVSEEQMISPGLRHHPSASSDGIQYPPGPRVPYWHGCRDISSPYYQAQQPEPRPLPTASHCPSMPKRSHNTPMQYNNWGPSHHENLYAQIKTLTDKVNHWRHWAESCQFKYDQIVREGQQAMQQLQENHEQEIARLKATIEDLKHQKTVRNFRAGRWKKSVMHQTTSSVQSDKKQTLPSLPDFLSLQSKSMDEGHPRPLKKRRLRSESEPDLSSTKHGELLGSVESVLITPPQDRPVKLL